MADVTLSIETSPTREDVARLEAGLTEHALPYTSTPGFQPIAVFARDDAGRIVGGAFGRINWNWLHVGLVWVDAEMRRSGLGRRVMLAIEAAARDRGCTRAHLDTFSYQARPFYERLGYEPFATLDDYPPGHQRFFLVKRLA